MRRFLFLVSIFGAGLLALLVTAMNAGKVAIELAVARFDSPLGLALVIAFTIGMLAGLAWRGYWLAELLSERGRLRRALRLAEASARAHAAAEERTR